MQSQKKARSLKFRIKKKMICTIRVAKTKVLISPAWPVQSQKKARSLKFRIKKKMICTIRVAKTKVLISYAVTAQLICAFVFAYADCWFSDTVAHIVQIFMYEQWSHGVQSCVLESIRSKYHNILYLYIEIILP